MGSLWNRSGLVERFGADDLRAAGAKAYFYSGGTTSPMSVYSDAEEASAHPFPVVADANGRWPDVFVPYIISYDVRVTTAEGTQLTYTQRIPNPDPIDLSVTIPASNQVQTGMVHAELINSTKAGYVRLNGRTLGNGSSGATERANADTSDLFTYLWNNLSDAIAPVSSGRGGSAAADYAANKTIVLPDCRGYGMFGLDDMGNSAAGAFSGLTFGAGGATTPGSQLGVNGVSLSIANMPTHSHTGTTSNDPATGSISPESTDHTHDFGGSTGGQSQQHTHGAGSYAISGTVGSTSGVGPNTGANAQPIGGPSSNPPVIGNSGVNSVDHTHGFSGTTGGKSASHTHTFTPTPHGHVVTTSAQGSGTAFNNMARSRLVTWYIKL